MHYEPGDFTLTARAGTTLAELASATLPHRQFLALDPYGAATGTLGATVATSASGPMAHAFGAPRDNVIGLEVITGDGAVVRCGGRVVKNVAGFDLTRLFTGSWGTLGVITEVSVRLRALPAGDETLALGVDERPDALAALVRTLRSASIAPLAVELLSAGFAARLSLPSTATLLVRLAGNATSIGAQRRRATDARRRERGHPRGVARSPKRRAGSGRCRPALDRFRHELPSVWTQARAATAATVGAVLTASLGRAVLRCVLPHDALRRCACSSHDATRTVIFERLPADLWSELAPSPAVDRLSRSVRDRFDPARVLNPGVLGEDA